MISPQPLGRGDESNKGGDVSKLQKPDRLMVEVQPPVIRCRGSRGERTQPWGYPVLIVWDMFTASHASCQTGNLWSTCKWSQAHSAGRACPITQLGWWCWEPSWYPHSVRWWKNTTLRRITPMPDLVWIQPLVLSFVICLSLFETIQSGWLRAGVETSQSTVV